MQTKKFLQASALELKDSFHFSSREEFDERRKLYKVEGVDLKWYFSSGLLSIWEPIDLELLRVWPFDKGDVDTFFIAIKRWSYHDKVKAILAGTENIEISDYYNIRDCPLAFWEVEDSTALARTLVQTENYLDVPPKLYPVIDYKKIGRILEELNFYKFTVVADKDYAYRVLV